MKLEYIMILLAFRQNLKKGFELGYEEAKRAFENPLHVKSLL